MDDITEVLQKLKRQRDQLETAIVALTKVTVQSKPARPRKRFNAATRAKMAAAQKARWARIKKH